MTGDMWAAARFGERRCPGRKVEVSSLWRRKKPVVDGRNDGGAYMTMKQLQLELEPRSSGRGEAERNELGIVRAGERLPARR